MAPKERLSEHKGYVVNNKLTKATGEHFNQKGHKVSDMSVTVLEKIFFPDPAVRKERENDFIAKMNTRYKGFNKFSFLDFSHFLGHFFMLPLVTSSFLKLRIAAKNGIKIM